jgi:hypothetical protein
MRKFVTRVGTLEVKLALTLTLAALAWAQYPAPSDPPKSGSPNGYPPNGYPPGTAPQDPNIGAEQQIPRHESKKKQSKKQKEALPVISAEGLTLHRDDKYLVVKVADGRTLTMSVNSETQWTRSGTEMDPGKVIPRTTVHVDMAVEDNYDLTAKHVDLLKDAAQPSAELVKQAQVQQQKGGTKQSDDATEDPDNALLASNTILHEPDAPDHPVLRRHSVDPGEKAEVKTVQTAAVKKSTDLDFTIDDDSAAPAKRTLGTELLNRTLEWAGTFGHDLPNYVCEQTTTRYAQHNRSDDWQAQDVIAANIVFEDGHETYEHISVDNKPTKKSMMELGGQTSTGEFGGIMVSLFEPVRNTDFNFLRSTMIGDNEVAIYTFKVALANSDWNIIMGGQDLAPAYSGKIWVDKKTAQILRFEQQADNIPKDFPEDIVMTAVDYESIAINGQKFLLPVHAENLGCERGSSNCSKNVIEFRNYHKYEGEGSVTFH